MHPPDRQLRYELEIVICLRKANMPVGGASVHCRTRRVQRWMPARPVRLRQRHDQPFDHWLGL
jgi:hypothetical protein